MSLCMHDCWYACASTLMHVHECEQKICHIIDLVGGNQVLPAQPAGISMHICSLAPEQLWQCRDIAAEQFTLPRVWEGLKQIADYSSRIALVEEFNRTHAWRKRGLSINPCR